MKISDQQVIGHEAEAAFQALLPGDWVSIKPDKDFGKDLHVEIFENRKPTGLTFYAQVKGTRAPNLVNGNMVVVIKTSILRYYLKMVSIPVFLVGVDVTTRECYWLFIQEYAKTISKQQLSERKTHNIRIPIGNNAIDRAALRSKIEFATQYMKELHPSSIPASIDHFKSELLKQDPRFDYEVIGTEDGVRVVANPKEDVPFSLSIGSSPETRKEFYRAFEKGEPIIIEGKEITELTGLKFATNLLPHKIILTPLTQTEYDATLSLVDESNQDIFKLDKFHGQVTRGSKQVNFIGGIQKAPLKFRMLFEVDDKGFMTKQVEGGFSFDLKEWFHQNLLALAYFNQIQEFFIKAQTCNHIKVRVDSLGNYMFTINGAWENNDFYTTTHTLITYLKKTRDIARHLGLSIILKPNLDNNDFLFIDCIHDLLFKGKHSMNMEGYNPSANYEYKYAKRLLGEVESHRIAFMFEFFHPELDYPFLGEKIKIKNIIRRLVNLELKTGVEEIRSYINAGDIGNKIRLSFEATERSRMELEIKAETSPVAFL